MFGASVRTTALPRKRRPVGPEPVGKPERSNEDRDVLVTRTIRASTPEIPPGDDDAEAHPPLVATVNER
jgi:hypothetical protein